MFEVGRIEVYEPKWKVYDMDVDRVVVIIVYRLISTCYVLA